MEAVRFAMLGLATGAIFALLSQGLVLIYRGSGLLNFAQGAMAMLGAYVYYECAVRLSLPLWLSAGVAIIASALVGALIHLVVLRPMRATSPLSRVIATLAIVLIVQSGAYILYGYTPLPVPSLFPTRAVFVFTRSLPIGMDQIFIFVICLIVSVVLYFLYRVTPFGRVTTAVAENQFAAASFGHSPDVIAAANWALGSALAGAAGVLIAPIIFLEPTTLVLLVIPAMSAALIGRFTSFWVTFVAALVLGVVESEIQRYVSQPGWATAAPFLLVIAVLMVRGTALPLRGFVLDRMPSVGSGRIRPLVVGVLWGAATWITLSLTDNWATAAVTTIGAAIICASVVVLTGYAGQLSLAQYVIAGVGALIAAHLAAHMSFVLAVIVAVLITALIAGLLGAPALRTRGITLAVVTLGLAGAVADVVLNAPNYTGGYAGLAVPTPSAFGWSIDPIAHPQRYAFVAMSVLVLILIAIANLRRSVTGRRLLAVRSNERAAASLGVSVSLMKSYAFIVAGAIAAIGGITLAFVQPMIQVNTFDVFTCVLIVAVTVAGGVGYVPGAVLGSTLIAGGIFSQIFNRFPTVNAYLPLVGGVSLVLVLIFGPDGMFESNRLLITRLVQPIARRIRLRSKPHPQSPFSVGTSQKAPAYTVAPRRLVVAHLSVSFGGVQALSDVSMEVHPAEIHGLIGANGAGKTTLIDAVTGFARAQEGSVTFGDSEITDWPSRRRAIHGLCRSFQSLELFNDLTILENLAAASHHPAAGGWRLITDFVAPGRIALTDAAQAAIVQFELQDVLGQKPTAVSFGKRKVIAIARTLAMAPSIVLLDEPAAGLDDREVSELSELIRDLAHSWHIGVLLVEHNVDLVLSISDRVTVLDRGKVLATGTPDEIRSNPAVLESYIGGSHAGTS